ALDELGEPGLVERNLTAAQCGDASCIDVDARDVVAEVREPGAGDQPDVARADHSDLHGGTLPCDRMDAVRILVIVPARGRSRRCATSAIPRGRSSAPASA